MGRQERVLLARAEVADSAAPPTDALPSGAFCDDLTVQTGTGHVRLLEVRPASGKLMPFPAFANGRRIAPPDRLAAGAAMTDVPHERSPELDGRTAAVRAVADALSGRRFVNESLRQWRAAGQLLGREAALATELGQGAVRHLLTIEHVLGRLARYDRAHLAPRLRAILCTAVYQIIWMDRIPPFAAVDQAVELARRQVRGRAPRWSTPSSAASRTHSPSAASHGTGLIQLKYV